MRGPPPACIDTSDRPAKRPPERSRMPLISRRRFWRLPGGFGSAEVWGDVLADVLDDMVPRCLRWGVRLHQTTQTDMPSNFLLFVLLRHLDHLPVLTAESVVDRQLLGGRAGLRHRQLHRLPRPGPP